MKRACHDRCHLHAVYGLPGQKSLARGVKDKDARQGSRQGGIGVQGGALKGLHQHEVSRSSLHPVLQAGDLVAACQPRCLG